MNKHRQRRGVDAFVALATLLLTVWTGSELFAQGQVAFPPGGGGAIGIPALPVLPAPAGGGDTRFRNAVQYSASLHSFGDMQWTLDRLARHLSAESASLSGMSPEHSEPSGHASRAAHSSIEFGWSELRYRKVTAAQSDVGGYRSEVRASVGGKVIDRLHGGFAVKNARTFMRGQNGWEMESTGAEGHLSYALSDWLSTGIFASSMQLDVEGINGNGSQHAAGGALSGRHSIGATDITLTVALAKTFEDVVRREHDTVFCSLFRVSRNWRPWLSTSAHVFFNDSLRDNLPRDRSYFRAGVNIAVQPHQRLSFQVGYDCTLALNDAEEQHVETGITWRW